MKTCTKCGKSKPLDAFGKNMAYPGGKETQCRECKRAYFVSYYAANKQAYAARSRAWQLANPEKVHSNNSRRRSAVRMTAARRIKSNLYRKSLVGKPCHYCGKVKADMVVDHYYPLAKGGTDDWWNLVPACAYDNRRKSDKLASVIFGVPSTVSDVTGSNAGSGDLDSALVE